MSSSAIKKLAQAFVVCGVLLPISGLAQAQDADIGQRDAHSIGAFSVLNPRGDSTFQQHEIGRGGHDPTQGHCNLDQCDKEVSRTHPHIQRYAS